MTHIYKLDLLQLQISSVYVLCIYNANSFLCLELTLIEISKSFWKNRQNNYPLLRSYQGNTFRPNSNRYGLYDEDTNSYNNKITTYGDNSRIDAYGAHSGYGGNCCDLVVDPLTFIALVGFIALATYFLQQFIEMSMLEMMRRKKRKRSINEPDNVFYDVFQEGKKI